MCKFVHKWSVWEKVEIKQERDGDNTITIIVQKRKCVRCNLEQYKKQTLH